MKQAKVGGLLGLTVMMLGWHTPGQYVSGIVAQSISIQSQSPLLLQVDEQGNLILDGEVLGRLERFELKERLRARLRERNTHSILVNPSASLSYDKLAGILDAARASDATDITVSGLTGETTAFVPTNDPSPAQQGEISSRSVLPSKIPTTPPLRAPVLPAAGIDIDPALYRNLPKERSTRGGAGAQQSPPPTSGAPQANQSQPTTQGALPTSMMLRVEIVKNGELELLHSKGGQLGVDPAGTVDDTAKLSLMLKEILPQRSADRRMVFIKPYATVPFKEVARVMETIRDAGGKPIGLQIDDLEGIPPIPPMCGSGAFLFPEEYGTSPNRRKARGRASVEDNRVFSPTEVTEKARVISRPEPAYTEEAKKNQVSGTVVLRGIVSSRGQLTSICVIGGLPYGLTETAIEAARLIKFMPAMKAGRPVPQYLQVEYIFSLY